MYHSDDVEGTIGIYRKIFMFTQIRCHSVPIIMLTTREINKYYSKLIPNNVLDMRVLSFDCV